jgi:G3E family GTPase
MSSRLEQLVAEKGLDLLRIKGLVNVLESLGCPFVVHAVQHLFHPPATLASWPGPDERSRMIFITNDIPLSVIADALRVAEACAAHELTLGTSLRSTSPPIDANSRK